MGISAVPSEIKSPAAPAAARGRVAIQGWGAGPPWVSVSRSCSRGSHWPPHLWACAHGVQLAVLAVRTKAAETRPPSLRQGQNRVTEPPVSPLSACTLRTHTCHRGGLVSVVCFGFLSPSWRISAPGALSSLSHSVLLWGPPQSVRCVRRCLHHASGDSSLPSLLFYLYFLYFARRCSAPV